MYGYRRTVDGWQKIQKLTDSGMRAATEFGSLLALDGNWAAICGEDTPAKVHMYRWLAEEWTLQEALLLAESEPSTQVTIPGGLSLDGSRLLVLAGRYSRTTDSSIFSRGAGEGIVYQLDDSNRWQREVVLGPGLANCFGGSDLSDGTVVLGGSGLGGVLVFRAEEEGWELDCRLAPSPVPTAHVYFGGVTAIDRDRVVTGGVNGIEQNFVWFHVLNR